MKIKNKINTYSKITNLKAITRRYFINNFYDGMLTVLGILIGFFIIILNDPYRPTIESVFILLPGLGTSISMLVSGASGSYLSEGAEQKKKKKELEKAMLVSDNEDDAEKIDDSEILEIQKAMVTPLNLHRKMSKTRQVMTRKNQYKKKTIYEKAESFARIVISFVNGGSPLLGGLIPLIPFFLIPVATVMTFIFSFIIIIICIALLGIFLGLISKESILKSVFQMILAFLFTFIIVLLLLGITSY